MQHESLILTQKTGKELSKQQKKFNDSVKKINDLKQKIERDTQQLKTIMGRVHADIVPLQQKHNNTMGDLVLVFDKHYSDTFFKKKEKEKMADFITNTAYELLEELDREDLKQVYEKYAEESYDETNAQAESATAEMMKNLMGLMFGVDIDDDADLSDPAKAREYMAQKMAEKQAEFEAKKANKKKTAKQLEREEKAKEETKNVSKAARTIYTDLVKAFHPDREPDENERARKTEIMKQVTEAYGNDDLFELLRLKIELQGADIEAITMAEDQLKYYNKILKDQIQELEQTHWQIQMQGSGEMGNGPDLFAKFGGDEKTMKSKFTREMNRLKKQTKLVEQDIEALRIKENMRKFLKDYEIEDESFSFPF
jgi:hypothetical protein